MKKIILYLFLCILFSTIVYADTDIFGNNINCSQTGGIFCDDFEDNILDNNTHQFTSSNLAAFNDTNGWLNCTGKLGALGHSLRSKATIFNTSMNFTYYIQFNVSGSGDNLYLFADDDEVYDGGEKFLPYESGSRIFIDGVDTNIDLLDGYNYTLIFTVYNNSGNMWRNWSLWMNNSVQLMNYTGLDGTWNQDRYLNIAPWDGGAGHSAINIFLMQIYEGSGHYEDINPFFQTVQSFNFSISLNSTYNGTGVDDFSVLINGTTYTTTNGTIHTRHLTTDGDLYNISVFATGTEYYNLTYLNYDISTHLLANITPYPILRINAFDLNNFTIANFTVRINTSLVLNTTNGSIWRYGLRNQTSYNISIEADYYSQNSTILFLNHSTISQTLTEYNFSLYDTGMMTFSFFDAETYLLIENVTFEIISDSFADNYSTHNGTFIVNNLDPDEYTIRYESSQGYDEHFYHYTLDGGVSANMTLYMTRNTSATQVTASVVDEGNKAVEDAYVHCLRWNTALSAYQLVEICRTNFEGECRLNSIVLNDEFYQFIIHYPLGTVEKTTTGTYIYENTIQFQISLDEAVAEYFYNSMDVLHNISFLDANNNFRYLYTDPNLEISQSCLRIYRIGLYDHTQINSTCLSATSGNILIAVDNITGVCYKADAYIYFDNDEYFIESSTQCFDEEQMGGNLGVFAILLLTMVFAYSARWSKAAALLITPIPLFFGVILNIIDLPIYIPLGIEIVCFIIAVIISRRN